MIVNVIFWILVAGSQMLNYTPHRVRVDGNCLFNAFTLGLYGTESDAYELRVRVSRFMHEKTSLMNPKTLTDAFGHDISEKDMWFIFQSSFGEEYDSYIDNMLKKRSQKMLNSGIYASIVEVFYLGLLLEINLSMLYPSNNTHTSK